MEKRIQSLGFFPVLVLSFFAIIPYTRLFGGFFQQDEWYGFAWYILHKNLAFWDKIAFFFAPSIGHFNPLTIATTNFLFSTWGLSYHQFLILSLGFHAAVTITVFYLARLIFKDRLSSFITAFLFSVLAAPYQGTAWVVANIATQWSSFLAIISTILFLKFLENRKIINLSLSLFFLTLSLLFKEITIGLFPLFMVFYLISQKAKKLDRKVVYSILTVLGVYLVLRGMMIFAPNIAGDKLITETQSISKLIYNFLTVPFKSLSQSFIPVSVLKEASSMTGTIFSEKISGIYGSPVYEVFVVKRIMEGMSLVVALIVLVFSVFIIKKLQDQSIKLAIILGISWVFINSPVLALAPENSGVIFAIDSRNLYFISVGSSILIIALVKALAKKNFKGLLIFIFPIIFLNCYWLNNSLVEFANRGKVRRQILSEITTKYPDLPAKVVFYTESDQSYYGLPADETILPFQSGLGQTLLAWYYSSEKFPDGFFKDRFLWNIRSEGYREIEDRGFGYYRHFDSLKKAISEYNVPTDSVIAFRWNGKAELLTDVSSDVREKLKVE